MHFDLDAIGSESHGFVRKRKMGNFSMTQEQLNVMAEQQEMLPLINFYFQQEVKKRQRKQ